MKLIPRSALADKGIPHGDVQLWRLIKAGEFPKPVKIGSRNAFVELEVDDYIAKRIAARDEVAA